VTVAHYAVVGVEDHEVTSGLISVHELSVSDVIVTLVIDHQIHINVVSFFVDPAIIHR